MHEGDSDRLVMRSYEAKALVTTQRSLHRRKPLALIVLGGFDKMGAEVAEG